MECERKNADVPLKSFFLCRLQNGHTYFSFIVNLSYINVASFHAKESLQIIFLIWPGYLIEIERLDVHVAHLVVYGFQRNSQT